MWNRLRKRARAFGLELPCHSRSDLPFSSQRPSLSSKFVVALLSHIKAEAESSGGDPIDPAATYQLKLVPSETIRSQSDRGLYLNLRGHASFTS